ncbi:right-handed parallel beta-helix repeat-containing protein [Coleofasciculus sp. FACHB-64]|uniref:right-handed parallel beta-helix repeat-containing protein n=1 Tax=Cyanophyceae TaxID=3028117 RepID=UPI001686A6CA|nr:MULTISPECIES: right-handed parallel beta-helix repeat-containing protein [unclassified Coleofasciculus]MBD1840098.1 right-handed parallel beta-helix repeat-containing protein [Coleofasciculus sp. FACHB-501]MBD2044897.1 right-handed parallel beta-helix repeat-containing protein [Coleofasciculus sp. FACHB-64]
MKFFQKLALTAALTTISINPSYAATFSVTSTADSGAGSLRQAILDANTSSGDDIIDFLLGGEPQTINVSSGLDITDNLFINGLGADLLSVRGDTTFDLFSIASGATVEISGLTVTNGRIGILNLGTLTVNNSSISGNGFNGIQINQESTLTVNNSTISGNGSTGINNNGMATVTNSTISGNGFNGINSTGPRQSSILTLTNSTITNNGANGIQNNTTVNIGNTIVAQNSTDIRNILLGVINDQGYNLIGNGDGTPFAGKNGVNGNIVGTAANPVDPLLGPLANNGGSTQTQALLPGSPAIDAANPNSFPATDQRGVTRPQGARADIGAFEVAQTPSPQPVPEPGSVLGLAGLGLFGLLRKKVRFNHQ